MNIEKKLKEIEHIKASKRRKWHRQIKLANSQIVRLRYEPSKFHGLDTFFSVCDAKGINSINNPGKKICQSKMRMCSLSQSVVLEETMGQEFKKTLPNVKNDFEMLMGMDKLRCQSRTENHHGRNHTIKIPTQSGEPCRG